MVRRVISQSGTGLAPWSINRQPMKLLERFSQDFNCTRSNDNETLDCINTLLDGSNGEIYRLHLSLNIGKRKMFTLLFISSLICPFQRMIIPIQLLTMISSMIQLKISLKVMRMQTLIFSQV